MTVADVAFLGVILGFFALCWLYVRGCALIVGDDDAEVLSLDAEPEPVRPEVSR